MKPPLEPLAVLGLKPEVPGAATSRISWAFVRDAHSQAPSPPGGSELLAHSLGCKPDWLARTA